MKTLVIKEMKKSIDVMDEFVDGDYDYLELRNWFSVRDSCERKFSLYDNSGRMYVSLIISNQRDHKKVLCDYEPTMTELRQMNRSLCLDLPYADGSMCQIIRDACKSWEPDKFIPLSAEICLRAQTSYNRMDYGCEWLGGGDWEEKTLYGETTDFYIVGIVMSEPPKSIQQEAREIVDVLKDQLCIAEDSVNEMLSALKNTNDIVVHKLYGKIERKGKCCGFDVDRIMVQFENGVKVFPFPDSFFNGFLFNDQKTDIIKSAKLLSSQITEIKKKIDLLECAIHKNDIIEQCNLIREYNRENLKFVK